MVYIDINMPKDCYSCKLRHNIGCNIANANGWRSDERDARCPLKEEIEISPLTEEDLDEELTARLKKYGWLKDDD